MSTRTMVLLSGGLDSTAALLWAQQTYPDAPVSAAFIYYGQPAAGRESERALAVRRTFDLDYHRLDLASAYYGGIAQGVFASRPAGTEGGLDTAFVPCRNSVLLTAAAARAQTLWPRTPVRLVAGFNSTDAAGFPDCRPEFVKAVAHALNLGLGEELVSIEAPWMHVPKAGIVQWVRDHRPEHMPLIEMSWSCYRERGPCGECTACVTRAAAFAPQP